MAPRREPPLMMVPHMACQISMKESGPEATEATPATSAPLGRRVVKSVPMPPPCCMVRAARVLAAMIPAMESSTT